MGATELWLVRHGESAANVASFAAESRGLEVIPVEYRDADVPLSATGEEQARALGDWLAENITDAAPSAVWASPYLRAQQTVAIAMSRAGLDLPIRIDERLRDRELGILDLLTKQGVEARYPEEAQRRRWLGKFYYRPPGGESWADVALRLRSFLRDVDLYDDGGTVLAAAHDAVIMLFLYVCNGLTEKELLGFAREHTVANASVTKLTRPAGAGRWSLESFSHEGHLHEAGVPVTEHAGDTSAEIL
ncbi:MAG: histidine phosphatase family protein [Microbacteriaceae bacterium]|jgi:broad specificity phosphatase PhoE|nr:histidine phosphatase family protein [Microbacteriaceae bacterium]